MNVFLHPVHGGPSALSSSVPRISASFFSLAHALALGARFLPLCVLGLDPLVSCSLRCGWKRKRARRWLCQLRRRRVFLPSSRASRRSPSIDPTRFARYLLVHSAALPALYRKCSHPYRKALTASRWSDFPGNVSGNELQGRHGRVRLHTGAQATTEWGRGAMKLLTHNMLECHIKGVTNKYPFVVEAQQVETCECDFNPGAPEPPFRRGVPDPAADLNSNLSLSLSLAFARRFPATHVSQARLEGVQGHCGGGESSSPRSCSSRSRPRPLPCLTRRLDASLCPLPLPRFPSLSSSSRVSRTLSRTRC